MQPLQRIERQKADEAEREHGARINSPTLFARRIDAGELIECAFDWNKNAREDRSLTRKHMRDISAERNSGGDHGRKHEDDLRPTNDSHDVTSLNPNRVLEFFGVKERVDEVDAKHEGDAEADYGLIHGALPSKICAGARVSGDQYK